jgi:K+-transporting ATPase KdpF subunit
VAGYRRRPVPLLHIVGGVVSLGLLVYLVLALVRPELFQ